MVLASAGESPPLAPPLLMIDPAPPPLLTLDPALPLTVSSREPQCASPTRNMVAVNRRRLRSIIVTYPWVTACLAGA
jgi:hypothetical protein